MINVCNRQKRVSVLGLLDVVVMALSGLAVSAVSVRWHEIAKCTDVEARLTRSDRSTPQRWSWTDATSVYRGA